MTEYNTEVTRRQLVKRIAASSMGAGALALAGPGAVGNAAAADMTLVQVDLTGVEDAAAAIQDALGGDNESANRIVHVCGPGTYPLTRTLRFVGKTDVHLVIDDDITFTVASPRPYMMDFWQAAHCSVTGGVFDASNRLFQDGREPITGTFVTLTGANNLAFRDMSFTNNDGWVGAGGLAPPVGIRGSSSWRLSIVGCSFELVQFGISLTEVTQVTAENCLVANLLDSVGTSQADGSPAAGGAFYVGRQTNRNLTLRGNQTKPGEPTYRDGEVGGSVIQLTPAGLRVPPTELNPGPERAGHSDVTVSDNYFYSPPGPFAQNTGVAGDVIALKSVRNFRITRNVVENGGEFGIVVSHGSTDGVISENVVSGIDGGALIVGAENDIVTDFNGNPYQGNPRVSDIRVADNLVVNPGIDANGTRRRQARPERTTTGNYPNAITGIRIWNAADVTLERNVVNQYRSSGIWIKDAFSRGIDDRLAEFGVTEKELNEVTGLTIADNNVMVPWSDGEDSVTYNDANWNDPTLDAAAIEPWSGTSFRPNENGSKSSSAVFGIEASQVISRAAVLPEVDHCVVLPEVIVTVRCQAGRGRIDTRLQNSTDEDAEYEVSVSGLTTRVLTVPAGESALVPVTGRPNGTYIVGVVRDGSFVSETEVTVTCGG